MNKQTHSGSTGFTEHSTIADIIWWIDSGQLRPAVGSAVLRPDGVIILIISTSLLFLISIYVFIHLWPMPASSWRLPRRRGMRFTDWRAHRDQPLMGRCSTEFWCSPSLCWSWDANQQKSRKRPGGGNDRRTDDAQGGRVLYGIEVRAIHPWRTLWPALVHQEGSVPPERCAPLVFPLIFLCLFLRRHHHGRGSSGETPGRIS